MGHGAFSLQAIEDHKQGRKSYKELVAEHQEELRTASWPAQLAKILNCDVVNLSQGGSANGTHARWLVDYLNTTSISDYSSVTVIWLLSAPDRFGIYSSDARARNGLLDIQPQAILNGILNRSREIKQFTELYLKLVSSKDSIKESMFYLDVIESYCLSKNYNFLYGNAFSTAFNYEETASFYQRPTCLHTDNKCSSVREFLDKTQELNVYSEICHHPSAHGYRLIADELYRILKSRNLCK